jgi:hypothetical protein
MMSNVITHEMTMYTSKLAYYPLSMLIESSIGLWKLKTICVQRSEKDIERNDMFI